MGGTKGYRSYRGRTSKGKIALAVLLVLIILAAVGFLLGAGLDTSYDLTAQSFVDAFGKVVGEPEFVI